MEKQFVTRELALRLKKLGFNEPCIGYYHNAEVSFYENPWNNNTNEKEKLYFNDCTAPLYQQAFDWFREKHSKDVHIKASFSLGIKIGYSFWLDTYDFFSPKSYKTFEEAKEACLEKLIQILEKNGK